MSTGSGKSLMPKLVPLTDNQSQLEVENFWNNLLFQLSMQKEFASLIDSEWEATAENENRGFEDTSELTAAQQKCALNFMLGTIASYVPVISRRFIMEQASSLKDIWCRLRVFYRFQRSGANILSVAGHVIKSGQSIESYWEDVYGLVEDSLLKTTDDLEHCGRSIENDEPYNPTLLNITVVIWLRGINIALPELVKRKYSRELKELTLYSLREDISANIPSLIQELESSEAGISRVTFQSGSRRTQLSAKTKVCCLCQTARRRPQDHYFQACPYLPENDKRFIQSLRPRVSLLESTEGGEHPEPDLTELDPMVKRVAIGSSPELPVTYREVKVSILLDYGAETNLASLSAIEDLHIPVFKTTQGVRQADGSTPLMVLGEAHIVFTYNDHHELKFSCLVIRNLPVQFLGGVPFHSRNDIYARISNSTVYIGNCCQYRYGTNDQLGLPRSLSVPPTPVVPESEVESTKLSAKILRVECQTTILPGMELKIAVPSDFRNEHYVAIEPRTQAKSMVARKTPWLQPTIEAVNNGQVTLRNSSNKPIRLSRHEQVCNLRATYEIHPSSIAVNAHHDQSDRQKSAIQTSPGTYFSDLVDIDPSNNQLSEEYRAKFKSISRRYDEVFNPKIGLYNGASGPFSAVVNMGSTLPPQRKGRCPQYSHPDKQILQDKFDELCENNVFATPESAGITVEYLNPSFLVKKVNSQGQIRGHRLVTSFGEVAQYCKPQPSLLPNVEDTLRAIGQWRYIIKTDLSSAYFQIPLSRSSLKFCGVCTPFKGIRVYTRCAMGMPGSETALEELMCRILGGLTKDGSVAKIADDLYCGGATMEEVLKVWENILQRLSSNGLRLSPAKTVICPASTTILGWLWNNGTISAMQHRVSALETCDPPATVYGLRAFLGGYKFLGKVIPNYCDILHPLEAAVGGRDTKEKVTWTDELLLAYEAAQKHLTGCKTLIIPRKDDTIRIITDASVSKLGLAATMFVVREGKPRLAGFFNAKLRPHQTRWLPCEIEALCIGSAVKHFSPYIIQSGHTATVLTDSRPCVQAYRKLCKGEFSSSARVLTFLSILSNYGIHLAHIRGIENLTADFSSRNPMECTERTCQVCKFVDQLDQCVVRPVTVGDMTTQTSIELFTNRKAWLDIQKACPVLNRVHAHLCQGTRPGKKSKSPLVKDVRRYLSKDIRVANDGLLVIPTTAEFAAEKDRIVIPRTVIHGITTAIHLKLLHPSRYQLSRVMERQFVALNMTAVIDQVHTHCDACTSIQKVPTTFKEQYTSQPDDIMGGSFSADVIRRCRQMILTVRENTSAYTQACFITNERGETLRDALISLLANFRSSRGHGVTVKTDPAPGFRSIVNDPLLTHHGVSLIIGPEKNINKNPIAERAIQEIHAQLTRLQPNGGGISQVTLALAISNVNAEIRNCGLSASEIWTQRDQFSSKQLPLSDRTIIEKRYQQRLDSHKPSAKYKARGKTTATIHNPPLAVGDLVYLVQDRDKTKARNRYIITEICKENQCQVQKFVGRQLRSHRYTVDLEDCLKVESSIIREKPRYDEDEEDLNNSDEENENDNVDIGVDPSDQASENDDDDNDIEVDSDPHDRERENDNDTGPGIGHNDNEADLAVRPRRARHLPAGLADYVMEYSSDSDSD